MAAGWQVVVVSAGGLVQAGGGAVFPLVITDTGWGGLGGQEVARWAARGRGNVVDNGQQKLGRAWTRVAVESFGSQSCSGKKAAWKGRGGGGGK